MLRRLSRGTSTLLVLVAALVVGLLGFTALGLGGDETEGAALTPRPHVKVTPYVPHALPPGRVGRSESIGMRENGGAGDPDAPVLSESIPFKPSEFRGPIAAYRRYAAGQVRKLTPEIARLTAAIRRSDRGDARAAWRVAFARYLRLGAVYGAFGNLDGEIDGLPGGLPKGERDPHFTGLHRLEMGLWTGESLRSLRPVAARLQRDVARLAKAVHTSEIAPLDYATRAHEILEDAQRDFLSGTSVKWSGEGVLATASGLAATQFVLGSLDPLLRGQQAQAQSSAGTRRLANTLAGLRAAHGGDLPTLGGLTRTQRQHLVGSLGWSLEQLQSVPGALETADPPAIPKLLSATKP